MKCSCPTAFDERTGNIVKAGTDQLCKLHGRADESGKCKACGAPIVQTPQLLREMAQKGERND